MCLMFMTIIFWFVSVRLLDNYYSLHPWMY